MDVAQDLAGGDGMRYIACPQCDTLHLEADIPEGHTADCRFCAHTLAAPRANSYARVLSLSVTALILMVGAVFFPFISVDAAGLSNRASVIDAVLAFSDGLMLPLSLAVALLIVLIPVARLVAIAYTLLPLVVGRRPFRYAEPAFRLAERLRPWSMAEIFIVGVAVALVKVSGLAAVHFGPAFWAFAGLVIVTVLQDNAMCRYTIWKALEAQRA